jgi:hypothetical protein
MECPLWRLLISSRSVSKHGHHMQFLFNIYSLLKMLYAFVSRSRRKPTWLQLKHSILRNFGGLESVDPVDIFYSKLYRLVNEHEQVIIIVCKKTLFCHWIYLCIRFGFIVFIATFNNILVLLMEETRVPG